MSASQNTPPSDQAYARIRDLVYRKAGIVLSPDKDYLIQSRLAPVARNHGFDSIEKMALGIQKGSSALDEAVIDALTTNETSFFRDVRPFDALRETVLPDLIAKRSTERRLNIWCGASSSGQEPYSFLILLAEHFPEVLGWDVTFLATDISDTMLARCREGVYSQLEVSRGLAAKLLVKHFDKEGTRWRVKPELRSMVEFRHQNLLDPLPNVPPLDLVMMRNVLIYFDDATKEDILRRTRRKMAPDGYLFLGSGEFTRGADYSRESAGNVNYYRPAA
ncbi:MAG: protein-glutamate O-methyltransferase CheR [Planctomycetota bacterium]